MACLWGAGISSAWAESGVLVLRPAGAPPATGLVQALRIQLSDAGPVIDGGELGTASLPERVGEAGEQGRRAGTRLALWVEPAAGAGPEPAAGERTTTTWLLYLVGQRDGRVLVDVVRVAGGQGPEVDRSLALKVREAHDAWATSTAGVEQLTPQLTPRSGPWGYRIALGAAVGALEGSDVGQWGMAVAAGAGWHPGRGGSAPGRWGLYGALQLRWSPGAQASSAAGRVELHEIAPGLWFAALHRSGRLALGLSSGLSARLLRATGTAPDGASGQRSLLLWSVPLALELQLALLDHLALRLAPQLEFTVNPERLSVAGSVVTSLPALRPALEISVVLEGP